MLKKSVGLSSEIVRMGSEMLEMGCETAWLRKEII